MLDYKLLPQFLGTHGYQQFLIQSKFKTITMKTLKLTLNKQWFDLIKSGVKTEEYREIKPYWLNRICQKYEPSVIAGGDLRDKHNGTNYDIKRFDLVEFTNGYNKSSPQVTLEITDITISTGNVEWGAVKDEQYFVIKLGKLVASQNC